MHSAPDSRKRCFLLPQGKFFGNLFLEDPLTPFIYPQNSSSTPHAHGLAEGG